MLVSSEKMRFFSKILSRLFKCIVAWHILFYWNGVFIICVFYFGSNVAIEELVLVLLYLSGILGVVFESLDYSNIS